MLDALMASEVLPEEYRDRCQVNYTLIDENLRYLSTLRHIIHVNNMLSNIPGYFVQ